MERYSSRGGRPTHGPKRLEHEMGHEEAEVECRVAPVGGFEIDEAHFAGRADEDVFGAEVSVNEGLLFDFPHRAHQFFERFGHDRMHACDGAVIGIDAKFVEDGPIRQAAGRKCRGVAQAGFMDRAEDSAAVRASSGSGRPSSRSSFQLSRAKCPDRSFRSGNCPIFEMDFGDDAGRQNPGQEFHGLGFVPDPLGAAEPLHAGPQLRERLFEDHGREIGPGIRRFDARMTAAETPPESTQARCWNIGGQCPLKWRYSTAFSAVRSPHVGHEANVSRLGFIPE